MRSSSWGLPWQGRRSGHTLVAHTCPAQRAKQEGCSQHQYFCALGRVGIISGTCSHRPRLRLSPTRHSNESKRADLWFQEIPGKEHSTAKPPSTLLLPPPTWPLQAPHTTPSFSCKPSSPKPLPTVFLRSCPAGHPGHCLPALYHAGISRDGIWHLPARPAPRAVPRAGERLLPALPLPPPLEASQVDSPQLGRAGEEESSLIPAPKPSESSAGGTGPT